MSWKINGAISSALFFPFETKSQQGIVVVDWRCCDDCPVVDSIEPRRRQFQHLDQLESTDGNRVRVAGRRHHRRGHLLLGMLWSMARNQVSDNLGKLRFYTNLNGI